ncbi:streptomycin 6-kinase [Microlunatus spumicola]|uniref:Streptomycin 6-kinase n=1 Tax=Microlunatus spumicola TaxID=81499 RepID=A0ABP6WWD9_9ACTN
MPVVVNPHDRVLQAVAAEWDLRVEGPTPEGTRAGVPVRTASGEAALLEHAPDASAYEHLALRAWDGRDAVRLLRADPRRHLLLTERTDPDDDLRTLDVWEACTEVGNLYAVLHRTPIPQPPRLADLAPGWAADLDLPAVRAAVPRRFLEQVRAWTPGLVDPAEAGPALLHGDLRPATVRATADRRWVAVAPRPVTGDPAYEVAAVLLRWDGAEASEDLRGDLLERFYAVVDAAGLDEDRARAWVVVRTVVELAASFARGSVPAEQVTWATTVVKAVQR